MDFSLVQGWVLGGVEATLNFYVKVIAHSKRYTTACVMKVSTPKLQNLSTAMLVGGFGSPQVIVSSVWT